MKKYFIINEYYKGKKNNVFKRQYPIDTVAFNTLEEARNYCKENNVTTYDISDDKKTIDYYWIEECEVDEDDEFLQQLITSDEYKHYPVTDNDENGTLIYDNNIGCYELVDNFYDYGNKVEVAEKLFYKTLKKGNLHMKNYDIVLNGDTLYDDNKEVVKSNDPEDIIRHLKNLNVYYIFIDKYIYGLEQVIFKR